MTHPFIIRAVEDVTRELQDFERAAAALGEEWAPAPVVVAYDMELEVGPKWDLRWERIGQGYAFIATIDGRRVTLSSWPVWFRLMVCECSSTSRQRVHGWYEDEEGEVW